MCGKSHDVSYVVKLCEVSGFEHARAHKTQQRHLSDLLARQLRGGWARVLIVCGCTEGSNEEGEEKKREKHCMR